MELRVSGTTENSLRRIAPNPLFSIRCRLQPLHAPSAHAEFTLVPRVILGFLLSQRFPRPFLKSKGHPVVGRSSGQFHYYVPPPARTPTIPPKWKTNALVRPFADPAKALSERTVSPNYFLPVRSLISPSYFVDGMKGKDAFQTGDRYLCDVFLVPGKKYFIGYWYRKWISCVLLLDQLGFVLYHICYNLVWFPDPLELMLLAKF